MEVDTTISQADPNFTLQMFTALHIQKAQIDRLEETNEIILQQYEALRQQIIEFKRQLYGSRSEKYIPDEQGKLFEGLPIPEDQPKEEYEDLHFKRRKAKKNRNGHHIIPDDLPRVRVEHEIPEEDRVCKCGCGTILEKIGEEITEKLALKPAVLYVLQHVRFKYAGCPHDNDILVADLPAQPIERGVADSSLIAHVLVDKYEYHQPLHRQVNRLARHGVELSEKSMYDWLNQVATLCQPLIDALKRDVLRSPRIHTDDTPAKVRVKGVRKAKKGFLWVYIGCFPEGPLAAIYDYTENRSQEGPQLFLQNFKGDIQADAYTGYDALFDERNKNDVCEVGCWMHARRGFYKIVAATQKVGAAHQALSFIKKLYLIETKASDFGPEKRKQLRQKEAKPVLDGFKEWLDIKLGQALPKSPLHGAVQYCLNHWEALRCYIEDGNREIDNGRAERAMRPIALGRNNWIAFGGHRGGEIAAAFYSLIETCKLHDVNTYEYFTDMLSRIAGHPINRVEELLPYHWKLAQGPPHNTS
jgi:transposase